MGDCFGFLIFLLVIGGFLLSIAKKVSSPQNRDKLRRAREQIEAALAERERERGRGGNDTLDERIARRQRERDARGRGRKETRRRPDEGFLSATDFVEERAAPAAPPPPAGGRKKNRRGQIEAPPELGLGVAKSAIGAAGESASGQTLATAASRRLRRSLRDPAEARRILLAAEVLNKPVALRGP